MAEATAGKVPVLECVIVSWRFLLENWVRFLLAAAAVSVVSALAPVVLGALLGGPTPAAVYASALIDAIAGIVFTAAVLRYAVRGEYTAPAGLGFAADEMRLTGILAALSLLFVPLVFVVGIAWSASIIGSLGLTPEELEAKMADTAAFNKMMAEAMSRPPDATVWVTGIIVGLVMLYLFTRLSMANAATIGERKFVFFQTWGWSKGNVLHMAAAVLMTALPALLLNIIISSMLSGIVVASDNPVGSAIYVLLETARSLIANLAGIPYIALGAHLYKGLRPPGFAAR